MMQGDEPTVALTVRVSAATSVSAGGALAFEDGRTPQREAMLSIKILK